MRPATIVMTGTANVASVSSALSRLGVDTRLAERPRDIASAASVVLPGVGTFGAAASTLDVLGMREVLRQRLEQGKPTLAICVGMQLLGTRSSESPGAVGLASIPAEVSRFDIAVTTPQLGWNRVVASVGCQYVTDGWAYFANSYRMISPPPGWTAATSCHGGKFVSALERGDVLACQFHPELSGQWGAEVLTRWLAATGAAR